MLHLMFLWLLLQYLNSNNVLIHVQDFINFLHYCELKIWFYILLLLETSGLEITLRGSFMS